MRVKKNGRRDFLGLRSGAYWQGGGKNRLFLKEMEKREKVKGRGGGNAKGGGRKEKVN